MAIKSILDVLSTPTISGDSARLKAQQKVTTPQYNGVVGYNASSPTIKVGTQFNQSTGQVKPTAPDVKGATTTAPAATTTKTTPEKTNTATQADASRIASAIGANDFLSSDQLNNIYNNSRGNADTLTKSIEDAARKNAEDQYNAIKSALSTQKGEVENVGSSQKKSVESNLVTGLEDLSQKQDTELKAVDKQKTEYQDSVQSQKEDLGRQWKDTSLEVQRIMRARGVADSGFAVGKETDLLTNFNQGLNKLAQTAQGALKDFEDAATETIRYYNNEKTKLQNSAADAINNIDTWVRQQVQSIQAQEGGALANKLSDIRNAILQGQQLKSNVEQKINDQQFSLAAYTYQMQQQYKYAVATAALGKTQDASAKIKQANDLFNLTSTILKNGGQIVQYKDDSGNDVFAVHGINPANNSSVDIPVTPGFVQGQALNKAAEVKNIYGDLAPDTSTILNEGYQGLGLPGNPFAQQTQAPAAEPTFLQRLQGLLGIGQ